MTMTFEQALNQPGPLLGALDLTIWRGERTLTLFSLAGDKAAILAHTSAPEGQDYGLTVPLRARGIPVGECDSNCEFVWLKDQDGVTVWGPRWRVLDARGETLTLSSGRALERGAIERIYAYASDDYTERGVRARLRGGEEVALVRDVSSAAAADPTYSRNELLFETEWAGAIAAAAAAWAGVPYENLI